MSLLEDELRHEGDKSQTEVQMLQCLRDGAQASKLNKHKDLLKTGHERLESVDMRL